MIYSFPLDYMHLCCLGITKKFYIMELLFNKSAVRLRSNLQQKLFECMTRLRTCVPEEFQRKPRAPVSNLKASEFWFLVLYAGPIVFKEILSPQLYNHFLLFHVAFRILCTKKLAQKYCENAQSYLKTFFLQLPQFYGKGSQILMYTIFYT